MKTTRMTIIALAGLTLLLGLGSADDAEAKIRVRATLRTPQLGIHFDNGPASSRIRTVRSLPVRHLVRVKVSKHDRRIAKRLAWYTGVSQRELIHLKRAGYSWNEIGRWLDVPRRVVKVAKSSRQWERFIDRQRGHARHGRSRGHRGCDICFDH